jgi:hypothetical protein
MPAPKGEKFQDFEFPRAWTGKDKLDWINGMLANKAAVASVELELDGEDDLVARVWFRKPGG